MGKEVTSTKDLKRVLGFWDLMSVAIGQIIGAGIFAMVGVGIAMTGRSVTVAFMIAAIFVIIAAIPSIFVGGTIRLRGGMYTQAAVLVGEKFAGFYTIIFILTNLSIAMYAISFADYMLALVPGLNPKLISITVLTIFFIMNLFGVKGAAKLQNLMVIIMGIALTVFVCFGVPQVQPGFFDQPDFLTAGIGGLLSTSALLIFATGGANVVLNLGAEAKNPTRDIPIVIIVATIVVACFYGLITVVAGGVLPISEVANQPLTLVAAKILPYPLYVFFIIGGAMFALSTTLNATLGWVTKPIMQACVDGWLPTKFAVLNKQKTPYILLTFFYFLGMFPILTGWDIGAIASFIMVLYLLIGGIMIIGTLRLPKVAPVAWAKSKYKVPQWILVVTVSLAVGFTILQMYLLAGNLTPFELAMNVAIIIGALIYTFVRHRTGKVKMEVSFEDA
ncbi:MAG: APC family permease [Turicibacter sp.]